MSGITDQFVDYLFEKAKTITETVKEKAEICTQDYQAVALAGARRNEVRWRQFIQNASEGNATLIGYDKRTDYLTAALVNGFNAHSLELDDGQRFAMIHLGASVISAINAARNQYGFPDDRYLTAVIMGYEAACRTAIAMQPSHKNRGYHTAGTCGTIGSAVGAAFALGMNKAQMKRVMTIAAGSAAGMLEMQEQGSEIKPYNVGRAAMDGLAAASMGLAEYDVPDDILGGERGFYRIFSDGFDPVKLTENATYFEIERIYMKPYASCRHSHSAVEAAILLHKEIDTNAIDVVLVETYRLGVKGHDHTEIKGIASAKLSTPYAVAAGLLYGRADLSVFEPLDNKTIDLAKKIRVVEVPELTAESSRKRIAIVTVEMLDGSFRRQRVDYAKGDPENPMTATEIKEKIEFLANYKPCSDE